MIIHTDTYAQSNAERVAEWYIKAVFSGYPLATGPRPDYGREYERQEALDGRGANYEF